LRKILQCPNNPQDNFLIIRQSRLDALKVERKMDQHVTLQAPWSNLSDMAHSIDHIVKQGRWLFAIAILAFGAENLIVARFGQAVVPVIPWATRPIFAYLIGAALLAAGLSIAANLQPRLAAILLGILFLICLVAFPLRNAIASPLDLGLRTLVFEILSMSGAALTLAGTLPAMKRFSQPVENAMHALITSGPYLFAISSVIFGIDHFFILQFIASLVPTWIPGSGLFWAYFTGAAFVAAGIGLATNWMARWAGALLGVMFLLWFLCLHAPRVMSFPRSHNPNEWSSAFIALGMCGGSWICAWARSQSSQRS
jgi:hypothetical protein